MCPDLALAREGLASPPGLQSIMANEPDHSNIPLY
jgi:hypothetical protein